MQVSFDAFTKDDFAKYPFLKGTAERIRPLDLRIDTLSQNEMSRILKRAEERVTTAITSLKIRDVNEKVGTKKSDSEIELDSYPVALLLVSATENSFIRKRYALAEAKEASHALAQEPKERLLKFAENFGWKLQVSPDNSKHLGEFFLNFSDYLRNTEHLRDTPWKLVNRILVGGNVYLNKEVIARLLEEEIEHSIEKRIESAEPPELPPELTEITEKLNKLATEIIGTLESEQQFPKVVSQSAFPPCVVAMYDAASNGRHLSHVGRFTLTSFLVTIGMSAEKVAEVFKTSSDYNARLTRYQVEHIAGSKGSGTKYTPPSCSTLQTHGVCVNSDELCRSGCFLGSLLSV
jgi:DNA primase large subunit